MKPKRIKSLDDLKMTIEAGSTKKPEAAKQWETFVTCQEMGVSIAAQASLFGVAYGTQVNRVNKYKYLKLLEDERVH